MASIMVKLVKSKIIAITVSAMALTAPSSASADDIALTFEDHGFTVSGALVRIEDDRYVVMTENGEMLVPVAMVTCEGTGCSTDITKDQTGS